MSDRLPEAIVVGILLSAAIWSAVVLLLAWWL